MQQDLHILVGIDLQDRVNHAVEVQDLLTEFGCNIKTRVGLHEVQDDFCAGDGLILLEMTGTQQKTEELIGRLNQIESVDAEKMIFGHD